MKQGDKVWLILEGWCTVGEIVSGTIECITGDLATVSFDFRMNPRRVSLGLLFPSREALCEHYRKIFEWRVKDIALDPYAESGQYRVPVTFETEDPTTRPTAAERVAKVRADLERHGLDPFKDKSRGMLAVALRQCVFLMLRREGYTQMELGDATGYDHSTVSWGEAHARDLVNIGDSLYTRVWNKVNMIDEGML